MRIIDARIHLWTGSTAPPHHMCSPYPLQRALVDMDEAGVAAAINCPPLWDPDAMNHAAKAANTYPTRFATLGWFDVSAPADETTVLTTMSQRGMLGLRLLFAIPSTIQTLQSDRLDWLWRYTEEQAIPVAFGVPPMLLERVAAIAAQHPRLRVMIDHLAVSPFEKLPVAFAHLDTLLGLARQTNVAIKASAVPGMSAQPFPFADTHASLRRCFDTYGAARMFWGTDITRMQPSWRDCIRLFTEELPWLKGRDLELVMGDGLAQWIDWRIP